MPLPRSPLIFPIRKVIRKAYTGIVALFITLPIYSFSKAQDPAYSLPSTIESVKVTTDKITGTVNASGDVVIKKDDMILKTQAVIYNDKKKKFIINNKINFNFIDNANITASEGFVSKDIDQGYMKNANLIFINGAFVKSQEMTLLGRDEIMLENSKFSLCPNPQIKTDADNQNSNDLITIDSKKTIINKKNEDVKLSRATIKILDVPIFYIPVLSFPYPSSKKRASGFLRPSYNYINNIGGGFNIKYYFNIASNKDNTLSFSYFPGSDVYVVKNNFRHLSKKGKYEIDIEIAKNSEKLKNSTIQNNIKDDNRLYLSSRGNFKINENEEINHNIQYTFDKDYLLDYNMIFDDYLESEIIYNINNKDSYHSLKSVLIQDFTNQGNTTLAFPLHDSYQRYKISRFIKSKFSLQHDFLSLIQKDDILYNRYHLTPKIDIPLFFYGNQLDLSLKLKNNFYHNNKKYREQYNEFIIRSTPESTLAWSMPFLKRTKDFDIFLTPIVNTTYSKSNKSNREIKILDSSNREITKATIFAHNRFSGLDVIETGLRVNYGFKSELLSKKYGDTELSLGQSYRKDYDQTSPVIIKEFDNKSNIIGSLSYDYQNIFSFAYNFQINDEYLNELNEILASINYKGLSLNSNYVWLIDEQTKYKTQDQMNLWYEVDLVGNFKQSLIVNYDFLENESISQTAMIKYDGCCVATDFSVTRSNQDKLTKAETSYRFNFYIKGL